MHLLLHKIAVCKFCLNNLTDTLNKRIILNALFPICDALIKMHLTNIFAITFHAPTVELA